MAGNFSWLSVPVCWPDWPDFPRPEVSSGYPGSWGLKSARRVSPVTRSDQSWTTFAWIQNQMHSQTKVKISNKSFQTDSNSIYIKKIENNSDCFNCWKPKRQTKTYAFWWFPLQQQCFSVTTGNTACTVETALQTALAKLLTHRRLNPMCWSRHFPSFHLTLQNFIKDFQLLLKLVYLSQVY